MCVLQKSFSWILLLILIAAADPFSSPIVDGFQPVLNGSRAPASVGEAAEPGIPADPPCGDVCAVANTRKQLNSWWHDRTSPECERIAREQPENLHSGYEVANLDQFTIDHASRDCIKQTVIGVVGVAGQISGNLSRVTDANGSVRRMALEESLHQGKDGQLYKINQDMIKNSKKALPTFDDILAENPNLKPLTKSQSRIELASGTRLLWEDIDRFMSQPPGRVGSQIINGLANEVGNSIKEFRCLKLEKQISIACQLITLAAPGPLVLVKLGAGAKLTAAELKQFVEKAPELIRKKPVETIVSTTKTTAVSLKTIVAEANQAKTLEGYFAALRGKELPEKLREQLEWAEKHPELFTELFAKGVKPLDIAVVRSRPVTVAEHARDFSNNPDKLALSWEREIDIHLTDDYGARRLRGREKPPPNFEGTGYEDLFRHDDLQEKILIGKAVAEKGRVELKREASSRGKTTSRDLPMTEPGVFIPQNLPQLKPVSNQTLYRISWRTYQKVEDAINHLINVGERAPLLKESSKFSETTTSIVRQTRQQSRAELIGTACFSTMTNCSPGKYYVSASSKNIDTIGENTGNLRIRIQTDRAFEIPGTYSNVGEAEFGVPFVINPREVRGGELNFGSPTPTRFDLNWSSDYRSVTVNVQDGGGRQRVLRYSYNPTTRSYVPSGN